MSHHLLIGPVTDQIKVNAANGPKSCCPLSCRSWENKEKNHPPSGERHKVEKEKCLLSHAGLIFFINPYLRFMLVIL